MKQAVVSTDNKIVFKMGFTEEELQGIIAGKVVEFVFDKFHNTEYRAVVKKLKV